VLSTIVKYRGKSGKIPSDEIFKKVQSSLAEARIVPESNVGEKMESQDPSNSVESVNEASAEQNQNPLETIEKEEIVTETLDEARIEQNQNPPGTIEKEEVVTEPPSVFTKTLSLFKRNFLGS